MKFLFMTDTHIKPENPKSRIDSYPEALKRKFNEVGEIIKEENIDYLLHGGDLFDRPDVPIKIVSEFLQIMKGYEVPIYMVAGNHDFFAQNPDTIERTYLGLLDSLDIIFLLDDDHHVILREGDLSVALIGKPFYYDMDKTPETYIVRERPDADIVINMVHGLLLDKTFFEGVDYITLDQVKDTLADITLTGHYHTGYPMTKVDDKYFLNPGSIARLSVSNVNYKRIPSVVIIEVKKDDFVITERPLKSAEPSNLIFDKEKVEQAAFKFEVVEHFKNLANNAVDFDQFNYHSILRELSTAEDLDEEIVKEAIERIGKVQELRTIK